MYRHRSPALLAALWLGAACTSTTESRVNPDQVVATIGAGGGTLVSRDSSLTVTIPAGALSGPTDITITPVDPGDLPAQFAGLDVAAAYELGPDGMAFATPITVTFVSEQHSVQTDTSLQFDSEHLLTLGGDTLESLDSIRVELRGDSLLMVGELRHLSPVVRNRRGGAVVATLSGVPDESEVGLVFDATVRVTWTEAPPSAFSQHLLWSSAPLAPIARGGLGTGFMTRLSATEHEQQLAFVCVAPGAGLARLRISLQLQDANGAEYAVLPSAGSRFYLSKSVECVTPLPKNLAVVLSGTGSGTVTSNPAGIACPQDCDEVFPPSTQVSLFAAAAAGSNIGGYGGDCTGFSAMTVVTLDRDRICNVDFIAVPPRIDALNPPTAIAGGPGFTLGVEGAHFAAGAVVHFGGVALLTQPGTPPDARLTALVPAALIANAGSVPVTVVNPGPANLSSQPVMFQVEPPPTPKRLTIVLQGTGGGTVTSNPAGIACPQDCDELFPPGTQVSLFAAAAAGSNIGGYGGDCTGFSAMTVVTLDRDRICNVEFIAVPPRIDALNPPTAIAGGPDFTLGVEGAHFAAGAVVHFGGVALVTQPGTPPDARLTALVPAALTANAGSVSVTVVNPGPANLSSQPVMFEVVPATSDPCTTLAPLTYGSVLTGTLGPGDCPSSLGFLDLFSVTTTQSASTLDITGNPDAFVVIGDVNADYADVYSFGTAASALLFVPPGTYTVVVGSFSADLRQPARRPAVLTARSGSPAPPRSTFTAMAPASYSVLVGPAASTNLANCQPAFARPGVTLTQTLVNTDCFAFNRFDPAAGETRYDFVNLNLGNGESATITMSSTDFDPVVWAICTNGVGQTRTFSDDNSGGGTTARLVIASVNYEQCRVEMTSRGANRGPILGAYTVTLTP